MYGSGVKIGMAATVVIRKPIRKVHRMDLLVWLGEVAGIVVLHSVVLLIVTISLQAIALTTLVCALLCR